MAFTDSSSFHGDLKDLRSKIAIARLKCGGHVALVEGGCLFLDFLDNLERKVLLDDERIDIFAIIDLPSISADIFGEGIVPLPATATHVNLPDIPDAQGPDPKDIHMLLYHSNH